MQLDNDLDGVYLFKVFLNENFQQPVEFFQIFGRNLTNQLKRGFAVLSVKQILI